MLKLIMSLILIIITITIIHIILYKKKYTEQSITNKLFKKELALKDDICDSITSTMPCGIFSINKSGKHIFVNKYWKTLTGISLEDALNMYWYTPFIANSEPPLYQSVQDKLLSGETFTCETCIKTQDNSEKWLEIYISPINNDSSDIFAFGTIIDITRYKIILKQLIEEQQKCEIANLSRVEFLSNITHEIRTPLNGIIGMSQLLHSSPLDDEQRDLLSIVKSSSNALLRTVNSLLNLSKLESGQMEISCKGFELHKSITNIFNNLKSLAIEKSLTFELNINENVPKKVLGDSQKLSQILLNIIGNAIKFTISGKINILVSLKTIENDKYIVLFVVEDTGIGISEDDMKGLFSYSMRINNCLTNSSGSTGLSLVITKELVNLLGGSIHLESKLSHGSKFSFAIPFDVVTGNFQEIESSNELLPQNTQNKLDILLADDDMISQKLILKIAQKQKWQLSIVSNGQQVLDILKDTTFDLILMDIHMPKKDGLETTKIIRKQEAEANNGDTKKRHLPIIAITANTLDFNVEKCQQFGIDDMIAKPIFLNELIEKINKLTQSTQ